MKILLSLVLTFVLISTTVFAKEKKGDRNRNRRIVRQGSGNNTNRPNRNVSRPSRPNRSGSTRNGNVSRPSRPNRGSSTRNGNVSRPSRPNRSGSTRNGNVSRPSRPNRDSSTRNGNVSRPSRPNRGSSTRNGNVSRPSRPNRGDSTRNIDRPRRDRPNRGIRRPRRISRDRNINYQQQGRYHSRHGHRPAWHRRENRRYRRYVHVPYRPVYREYRRYRSPRYYHYTLPYRYIYWNSWVRYMVDWMDGYTFRNYPYFVYNGYAHRYSDYDICDYQLVDGYTNSVEEDFPAMTCRQGYNLCARRRDDLNYFDTNYRYFCSENFDYDPDYNYNWNRDENFYSDLDDSYFE